MKLSQGTADFEDIFQSCAAMCEDHRRLLMLLRTVLTFFNPTPWNRGPYENRATRERNRLRISISPRHCGDSDKITNRYDICYGFLQSHPAEAKTATLE